MRLWGELNYWSSIPVWTLSCTVNLMFERVSRHVAYAGYFGPKSIELLVIDLERRGLINTSKKRGMIVFLLVSAMLGLVASRGHFVKNKKLNTSTKPIKTTANCESSESTQGSSIDLLKEEEKSQPPAEEGPLFDGVLGFLLN